MLSPRTAKAVVYLENIAHNYEALVKLAGRDNLPASLPFSNAPWPCTMPVVKADAYGLGHVAVARSLYAKGARLFGSGGLEEAADLALAMRAANMPVDIVALLGFTNSEQILLAKEHGIIPVVHCFEQLEMITSLAVSLPVALKFNSGMARLGFNSEDMPLLLETLNKCKALPVLALSHLACADEADGQTFTSKQISVFADISSQLRNKYPNIILSLCSSAGLMVLPEVQKALGSNLARPGLSLYGVHPLGDDSTVGFGRAGVLREALEVSCPVLARRKLLAGQGFGYGQTYKAVEDTELAILGIGYADGFSRNFSARGMVLFAGQRLPVIGRVSMQMIAVDCSKATDLKIGEQVFLLGGDAGHGISCNELSKLWQTTPHEILCMLGNNLHKEYR